MATVVVYDPSDPTVANRVTKYDAKGHTPDYDAETNKLVNPDLSALSSVPVQHWKYDGVSAIVEMSQAEKDSLLVSSTSFVESTEFISDAKTITSDQTFEDLGGVATNAQGILVTSGYTGDMTRAVGRVVFQVKTSGTDAEFRIVEIDDLGNVTVLSDAYAPGDTSGAWKIKQVTTNVTPSTGDHTWCLQGRLNGATSAEVRFASMTLLDVGP